MINPRHSSPPAVLSNKVRSQSAQRLPWPHLPHLRRLACVAALMAVTAQQASAEAEGVSGPPADVVAIQRDPAAVDLDAYPAARDQWQKGQFAAALATLQKHSAGHENDPHYFNLVGLAAIKAQDYRSAALALERVVLMQPENAGAWLDLAIAEAEIGNIISAQSYFDHIEREFAPPPQVRAMIARYRAKILAQATASSPWQFNVLAMGGVDSNANSGLQTSLIALTLGGVRTELDLDKSYQARSDSYALLGTGATYRQQFGDNRVDVALGLRKRTFTTEHNFSTTEVNAGVSLQRPTAIGIASVALQAEHLTFGGSALLRNVHAIAQIERPVAGCRAGLSAEAEWRRYVNLTYLNGDVLWGQLGMACEWGLAELKGYAALIGRVGVDSPTGARAGGKTNRSELVAQLGFPLARGATAELNVSLATARDSDAYFPGLEYDAARRLQRHSVRFSVTVPLTGTADLLMVAEDNRFTSNLALFQQSGRSVSVGLKQRF